MHSSTILCKISLDILTSTVIQYIYTHIHNTSIHTHTYMIHKCVRVKRKRKLTKDIICTQEIQKNLKIKYKIYMKLPQVFWIQH